MRLLFAFLSIFLLTAAAPTRDWSTVTMRLPSGAMLTGNPAAKLKLVEYGSYTCSHCATFSTESEPVLKGQMIRKGAVSLEYHHLVRDQFDLAAAILARCAGARDFSAASAAIYRGQEAWLAQAVDWQDKHPEVAGYPPAKRIRAAADGSGLTAKQVAACFADTKAVDALVAMTGETPAEVTGTPTFYLNGTLLDVHDWGSLEPILRAKGAK